MTDANASANLIVPLLGMCTGLALIASRSLVGIPEFLDTKKHPATLWAFTFWLAFWISLVIVYEYLKATSATPNDLVLLCLGAGDLALIASTILYCGGNSAVRWRRMIPVGVAMFSLVAYYLIFEAVRPLAREPLNSIIWVAPSILLANIAVVALGWAFLARWGYTALPFFGLCVLYSVAQCPAYVMVFAGDSHIARVQAIPNLPLDLVVPTASIAEGLFHFLAFGKAVLFGMPLLFFLSTRDGEPDMSHGEYWPTWRFALALTPLAKKLGLVMLAILCIAVLLIVNPGKIGDLLLKVIGRLV